MSLYSSAYTEGDEYYQKFCDSIEYRSESNWTAEKMMDAKPRMKWMIINKGNCVILSIFYLILKIPIHYFL